MIIKLSRLWLVAVVIIFGLGIYGIYWALRWTFSQSFFLGIVFLFFGLPFILRLLFVSLMGFLTASVGFLSSFGQEKHKRHEEDDGVIDVKGKIVK